MSATFKGLLFLACVAVFSLPPPPVTDALAGPIEDELRSIEESFQDGRTTPEETQRYGELVQSLQNEENPTPTPLPRRVRKVRLSGSPRDAAGALEAALSFSVPRAQTSPGVDESVCGQFNNLYYDCSDVPWDVPDSWTRDGEFGDVSVRPCVAADGCVSDGILGIDSNEALLLWRVEPGLLIERQASVTFRMKQTVSERNPQPDTTLYGGGVVWLDDGTKSMAVGFAEDLNGDKLVMMPIAGQYDPETGDLGITDIVVAYHDRSIWRDYRFVKDQEGLVELLAGDNPAPVISFPYAALNMSSLGGPAVMFGNLIDGQVARVLFELDYVNYSIGMSNTDGCTSADGRLRILSIENFRTFDPGYDTHTLKFLMDVAAVEGLASNTQSHKFFLRLDRTIRDAAGQPVRYLRDDVQIGPLGKGKNPSSVRATAVSVWDGSNLEGRTAPDGLYQQEPKISFIRVAKNGQEKLLSVVNATPAPTVVLASANWIRDGVMFGHWNNSEVEILICKAGFLWHFRDYFNDNDQDPSNDSTQFLAKLENAVRNAANVWNVYGGANIAFSYGGFTDRQECEQDFGYVTGKQLIKAKDLAVGQSGRKGFKARAWNFQPPLNGVISQCHMDVFRRYFEKDENDVITIGTWDWVLGFPDDFGSIERPQLASLQSIIAHELGHCLGFDDDFVSSANALMAAGSFARYGTELLPEDVYTLRFYPGHGYGTRRTQRARHLVSDDKGVSWSAETSSTVQYSNLKPAIATKGNSSQFVLAWADPDTDSFNDVKAAVGTGAGFETDASAPFGNVETILAPSIAYGNGIYMGSAAVAGAGTHSRVFISTSTDGRTWTRKGPLRGPSGEYIEAFKTPVLAFTKVGSANYWVLSWLNAYRGTGFIPKDKQYRVYSMVSTNNGETWANLQRYNNAMIAPAGYDISCDKDKNQCILAYPLADGTNRLRHHSCLVFWGAFGCLGYGTTGGRHTRDEPGLAFGDGYWQLAWRNQESPYTHIGVSRKSAWEYYVPWGPVLPLNVSSKTGVDMTYSDYLKRFVLYYIAP